MLCICFEEKKNLVLYFCSSSNGYPNIYKKKHVENIVKPIIDEIGSNQNTKKKNDIKFK